MTIGQVRELLMNLPEDQQLFYHDGYGMMTVADIQSNTLDPGEPAILVLEYCE